MASDNQLRARIRDSNMELIRELSKDRGIAETEAERVVVREGLAALGYRERPVEAADALLGYARKIGSVLGLVGMVAIGYGLFAPGVFSFIGFGLLLVGFGFISGAEFGPALKSRIRRGSDVEASA